MLPKPTAYYGKEIKDFQGIIGHVNIRRDKRDPIPDLKLWETLKKECNLSVKEFPLSQPEARESKKMTSKEINLLFNHNIEELNKMYIPAGSMVKSLIMELERKERNTYIKLHDAEVGGILSVIAGILTIGLTYC